MPAKAKSPTQATRDAASFEEFRKNFWKEFQGWLYDDQPSIKYDVDLDESELRQVRDRYLNSEAYPSLNELKRIIIFKNAEDRVNYGTDVTTYAHDFNFDLERGIKKALELARFDLGQVKPKIYQEEKTAETSPPKEILRRYEAAEIARVSPETISRWAREPDSFPVIWNKGETHIKGIPTKTFLEYLKGKRKNQS
jgi:hypothetical protein